MDEQATLLPLTPDEVQARARMVARLIGELESIQEDHAEEKKAMKAREDELRRRIRRLARSVRTGSEEPE